MMTNQRRAMIVFARPRVCFVDTNPQACWQVLATWPPPTRLKQLIPLARRLHLSRAASEQRASWEEPNLCDAAEARAGQLEREPEEAQELAW